MTGVPFGRRRPAGPSGMRFLPRRVALRHRVARLARLAEPFVASALVGALLAIISRLPL